MNSFKIERLSYFLNYSQITKYNMHKNNFRRFCTTDIIWSYAHNELKEKQNELFNNVSKTNIYFLLKKQIISRNFCTQRSDDDNPITETEEENLQESRLPFPVTHSLPATVVVPEHWPNVPLIAVSRNPVFPRFIKLLEVKLLLPCNLTLPKYIWSI